MKVGIAGAGGIGSNVARHLVQAGVRELVVIDFDRVAASNLDRQFYTLSQVGRPKAACLKENLEKISAEVSVRALDLRILPGQSPAIFKGCGLVVEGFDDPLAKKALVEDLAPLGLPMVSACGIAGRNLGQVRVKRIGPCHVVGDFSTGLGEAALFPPKIAMIAAMMAGIALELIAGTQRRQ